MGQPSRLAWAILLVAGLVLVGTGAAAVAVGVFNPGLISSQLPPDAAVDAPAVGGAAVALGVATALLGVLHWVTAFALRARVGIAVTGAVVLASTMAILALAFAVAAVVSIAAGSAPAVYMIPAAIGLGAAVVGYAVVTALVMGSRGEPI
ncbi:MAG TPA: hypothetical protein VL687_03080 [Methylomirabilota bacterium]|nr:hypothetical protein [Methylomirabilota bacterium]